MGRPARANWTLRSVAKILRMMSDYRISVVIPCRNESGPVRQLLDELRGQDTPIHEVIVVDNASTDDVAEALDAYRRQHPDLPLHVISCPKVGIPAALNAGIRAATGDVIVRFDAHSCPTGRYVREAVATLRETGAGVVGGVWEIAPGRKTVVAQAIARAVAHPMGAGDAAYRTGRTFSERRSVDTVPFGCFHKATWEQLGGFNERLLTNEDYEFNYRVRQSGRQVLLDPSVRSVYYARSTFGALVRQYFRYGWWKAQMLKSHPRSLRWRQAVPAAFVATVGALAVASVWLFPARVLLGALLLLYGGALTVAALRISGGRRTWHIFPVLPAVFATIHFAWGGGVLVNVFTLGRLPLGPAAAASDPEDAIQK
jgi:succinoglycan biosynthesis protein ExoA